MQLQDFHSSIITTTELRRDIKKLERILKKEKKAEVVSNKKIVFVAVEPNHYQELKKFEIQAEEKKLSVSKTVKEILAFRDKHVNYGEKVSDLVIKLRDKTKYDTHGR